MPPLLLLLDAPLARQGRLPAPLAPDVRDLGTLWNLKQPSFFKAYGNFGPKGNAVMTSMLACYAAGPGSILATFKWFFFSILMNKRAGSNKMEPGTIFACSRFSLVDEKEFLAMPSMEECRVRAWNGATRTKKQ